eukprot:Blabericola_migrator_1__13258@NODE_923_length_6034_cov_34_268309_g642_i0_p4_GENE_NODE_923_length_6034_cov_34_268309_g642_i0NODE_923_length_6034_cov_34_268309_g642_i0_p4_ORF_typecomplete_len150_score15_11_NODE_923_length_6034_cov_34_268309_g642_i043384787
MTVEKETSRKPSQPHDDWQRLLLICFAMRHSIARCQEPLFGRRPILNAYEFRLVTGDGGFELKESVPGAKYLGFLLCSGKRDMTDEQLMNRVVRHKSSKEQARAQRRCRRKWYEYGSMSSTQLSKSSETEESSSVIAVTQLLLAIVGVF